MWHRECEQSTTTLPGSWGRSLGLGLAKAKAKTFLSRPRPRPRPRPEVSRPRPRPRPCHPRPRPRPRPSWGVLEDPRGQGARPRGQQDCYHSFYICLFSSNSLQVRPPNMSWGIWYIKIRKITQGSNLWGLKWLKLTFKPFSPSGVARILKLGGTPVTRPEGPMWVGFWGRGSAAGPLPSARRSGESCHYPPHSHPKNLGFARILWLWPCLSTVGGACTPVTIRYCSRTKMSMVSVVDLRVRRRDHDAWWVSRINTRPMWSTDRLATCATAVYSLRRGRCPHCGWSARHLRSVGWCDGSTGAAEAKTTPTRRRIWWDLPAQWLWSIRWWWWWWWWRNSRGQRQQHRGAA